MGRNIRCFSIHCRGGFYNNENLREKMGLCLSMGKKYGKAPHSKNFGIKKKGKKRTLEVGKRKLGTPQEAKESEEMALKMAKEIEEMALEDEAAGAEEKK